MGQVGQPLAEKTNGTGLHGTERDVVVREAGNYGSEGWGLPQAAGASSPGRAEEPPAPQGASLRLELQGASC